jgi:hypothetical protein
MRRCVEGCRGRSGEEKKGVSIHHPLHTPGGGDKFLAGRGKNGVLMFLEVCEKG